MKHYGWAGDLDAWRSVRRFAGRGGARPATGFECWNFLTRWLQTRRAAGPEAFPDLFQSVIRQFQARMKEATNARLFSLPMNLRDK